MRYLAILLLAPWLLLLCGIFLLYPKDLRRTVGRRLFDMLAVLLMSALAVGAALAAFDRVKLPAAGDLGRASGAIWQQVLPALCGYGVFILVLASAMWLRQLIWGRRRPAGRSSAHADDRGAVEAFRVEPPRHRSDGR